MLRRTCSTCMAQLTTVKDMKAHLRHSSSATTLEHYIKSVPESVRVARPSAEESARGFRTACELNPIESNFSEERKLTY